MTVNERIRQVRHNLQLPQAKFAQAISISNGYIANIELGKRRVNERIIKLICASYDVSEAWLKTGNGAMFYRVPGDRLEKVLNLFKELTPSFQDYVLQQLDQLLVNIFKFVILLFILM